MRIGDICWARSQVLSTRVYTEGQRGAKKILQNVPFVEQRKVLVLGSSYRSSGDVTNLSYEGDDDGDQGPAYLRNEVRHRVIVCQEIDEGQRFRSPFVTYESELSPLSEEVPE